MRKGRGAVSNFQGRYDALAREEEESAPAFRTEIIEEQARNILTRNDSPDLPFDVSLNP